MLVQDVRTMFQVCRLVHADLSEYNILYYAGRLAIIDVSQVRLFQAYLIFLSLLVARMRLISWRYDARSRLTWTTHAALTS